MAKIFIPLVSFVYFTFCFQSKSDLHRSGLFNADTLRYPEEHHFKNMRQLTFGGDNAEAYFSFDGKSVIFQRKNETQGIMCDQIWMGQIPEKADEPFIPK